MKKIARILHLEDNPRDVQRVHDLIKGGSPTCEILVVGTRSACARALATGDWDVILADNKLLGGDGLAVLKAIHKDRPPVPVIILSESPSVDVAVGCMREGAADFLSKSDLGRLGAALSRAFGRVEANRRRFQAEHALRESEANLAQAQALAHMGSWEWNIATGAKLWSDEHYRIFGHNPQTVPATHDSFLKALHPDDSEKVKRALNEALEGCLPYRIEYRIVRPDGVVRMIEASGEVQRDDQGSPVRMVGIVKDITDQKKAEEVLRQTREQLQTIFDSAPLAILGIDMDGKILSWSGGAERLFGWKEVEVLGRFCPTVDPADHKDFLMQIQLASQGETLRRLLRAHQKKDGSLIQASITAAPYNNGRGNRVGALVILEDVTAQIHAERLQLRSQRLESIGTLAGGIAHDLNNSLAPIMMGVELLRMQYPGEKGILEMLEKSARHSADMVRQLLTFAKGAEGERVSIHPEQLVKDMGRLMEGSFPKNLQLVVNWEPNLPAVMGDPTQLHQVLLNLCVNARDAMPKGGTLTLEAHGIEMDATYASSIPDAKPGNYVMIQVRDTGVGIPHEIMDRIFEPFFTTKGPEKGTGLGLSTVMGIIKGHGGFVKVYSQPDQGTSFAIYLPIHRAGSPEAKATVLFPTDFQGQGELILFVDDESAIREVGRMVLRKLNFEPLIASDGADALIKAAEHRVKLRAIITDWHMPHMDGLSFVRKLRRMLPDIPVAVASGLMEDTVAAEFKNLDVSNRLDKPFTEGQLVEVLKKLLTSSLEL